MANIVINSLTPNPQTYDAAGHQIDGFGWLCVVDTPQARGLRAIVYTSRPSGSLSAAASAAFDVLDGGGPAPSPNLHRFYADYGVSKAGDVVSLSVAGSGTPGTLVGIWVDGLLASQGVVALDQFGVLDVVADTTGNIDVHFGGSLLSSALAPGTGLQAALTDGSTLWTATTNVTGGTAWRLPDGTSGVRTATGTTRSTFDSTESVLWTRVGQSRSRLEGLPLNIYGHSYTISPGAFCSPGGEFFSRLARRLNLGTVKTWGVGSSRMIDVWEDICGQAEHAPTSGSSWIVNANGLVVLDAEVNDVLNLTSVAGVFAPQTRTALRMANFTSQLTAALAILGASGRIEAQTGTPSGTWTTTAGVGYSGGSTYGTTVQNAFVDIPVTFSAAGVAYIQGVNLGFAPTGDAQFILDPAGAATVLGTMTGGVNMEAIYTGRSGGANAMVVGPWVFKATASAGAHTIRVKKTDATTNPLYVDAVFPQSATPPVVLAVIDPLPVTAPATGLTTQNLIDVVAAKTAFDALVTSAVAGFSFAHLVDLTSLDSARLSSFDGLHPNDHGMCDYADLTQTKLASLVAAYTAGVHRL